MIFFACSSYLRDISLWDRCCGFPCLRRDIALAFTLASPGQRRWKGQLSFYSWCCTLTCPKSDLFALALGVTLQLTRARRVTLQWTAVPALCCDQPWCSTRLPSARSEFGAKVDVRLPSVAVRVGDSEALPSDAFTPSVRPEGRNDRSEAEERDGRSLEVGSQLLMVSHHQSTPGQPGHRASLSEESRWNDVSDVWNFAKYESSFLRALLELTQNSGHFFCCTCSASQAGGFGL